MIQINKETKICISIAEKPGNFGAIFHNRGYNILGLNQIYLPIKVLPSQLELVINAVRELNVTGCSVSMPHKIEVMKYLDSFDQIAEKIGSVNTIVREYDSLKGYNTDYYGAKKVIQDVGDICKKDVIMIGAGGVAKAIGYAIKELGGNLKIINRDEKKAIELSDKLGASVLNLNKLSKFQGYLLINATCIGMNNPEESIIDEPTINNFEIIYDVVIGNKETKLIKNAKKKGKKIISGNLMTIYQAAEQFKLYTGYDAPKELINNMFEGITK